MMKRTVTLATAILLLGCGTPEPEPDWDVINREISVIEARLEICLETTSWMRHQSCYDNARWKVEDLAREHGVELDNE